MRFIVSICLALLSSTPVVAFSPGVASGAEVGSSPLIESRPAVLQPEKVADGVFVFIGALEDVAPSNHGDVINSGFIIGNDGVIVIDSGVNYEHGRAILAAIKTKTRKPVLLVINTHPHPENVLGNSAFVEAGARIVATPESVRAMKQRCELCYKHVAGILGGAAMAGTEIVIPEPLAERTIEVAGRMLKLFHFGWGHTEGDLAVLDVKSGVLFAGGLVSLDRIPVMMQARVKPWIASLYKLRKVPARILIPGHGPVAEPRRIADTLNYLRDLLRSIEKQYRAGDSVFDALRQTELPAYSGWALYPETHLLNVQHVYSELEKAEFRGSIK